mgnify:CR=1 FL=1
MKEISPAKVVVIHDNIEETTPIMVEMRVKYGFENVVLFQHSQEGFPPKKLKISFQIV